MAPKVFGTAGFAGSICPKTAGSFVFSPSAVQGPRRLRARVGQGPIVFQLHRLAIWPGAKTAATLKAQLAERTRGTTVVLKRTIPLDMPLAMDIPLASGRCTVVTLKLDGQSAWTAPAFERGISFNYSLPGTDLSAGPGLIGSGAISDLGCPGVTARVPMEITALGGGGPLGTGTATLEVRARAAKAGEVARERRMVRESAEETGRNIDQQKRDHCAKCRRESGGDPDAFDRCVRQWYRSGECD